MHNESGPNTELSPETTEVLKGIIEDREGLRDIDLADTAPATVFEAE